MDDGEHWIDGVFQTAEVPVICNIKGTDLDQRQQITQITEQHVSFGPNLNGVNEMVNNPEVKNSSSHTKKRKLKSKVWDEFTKHEEVDGKKWAVCNHCNKKFDGSSKKGTTHLKNHLDRCPTKRSNPGGSSAADKTGDCLTTTTTTSASADIIIKGKSKVDEEFNELDNIRMIIKNWVPLDSIRCDLFKVFEEEKQKLKRYFENLPCRFNLSIDWFGSYDYYVSVYFIDDNWEMKKKVIYFHINEGEDEYDERRLYEEVKYMVEDWNIDKDICSIVDHDEGQIILWDERYDEMKKWVSERGSLPFAGTLLFLPWLLKWLPCWRPHLEIMDKMRKLKEYLSSNGNNKKFEKAVDKAAAANSISMPINIKLTSQPLPDPTNLRGFELLEWAVALKEAFLELEHIDPIGFSPFKLTKKEWDDATAIYKYRKELRDIVNSLSDGKFTTPNVYFLKICHLYTKLLQWEKDNNDYIREVASDMRKYYFDDFWTHNNLVLTLTIILDPRFKLDIVKYWCEEIYDNHDVNIYLKEIIDVVTNIYNEYAKATENSKTSIVLDRMGRPCISVCHVDDIASIPSELDRYLEDPKFPAIEKFDILAWWNLNSSIYPTLARMARDYLAIPISVGHCLIAPLWNEIKDILIARKDQNVAIAEALVLTKIWLYGS